MVLLFLGKSVGDGCGDGAGSVEETMSLAKAVEKSILSFISSGYRHEVLLWLRNTVSCIHCISLQDRCDLFLDLLETKDPNREVSEHLLRTIFQKHPERTGDVLAKNCHMLEKFFQGHPGHITQWFDNFAAVGETGHRKGARAISQFAFANRDVCWEELVWKGKHGQSPAVVATKPHYFNELNVLQTVENFLEYVPDFWSSEELAEAVRDGDVLQIDAGFFVDQFLQLMYGEKCEDVWDLIEGFLKEESFSSTALSLLILLDEPRLLWFLRSLGRYVQPDAQCEELRFPCCWLELLLHDHDSFESLDEIMLLNALVTKPRQLLQILCSEEHAEEKGRMDRVLETSRNIQNFDHSAFLKRCTGMKRHEGIKWIGILSWILFYTMSRECVSPESCEMLFSENGIDFRRADEYSLVGSFSLDSDAEEISKRKRGSRRKRRRSRSDGDFGSFMRMEDSNGWQEVESRGRSWFLQIDGFSAPWHIADVPEALAGLCFRTWTKWMLFK